MQCQKCGNELSQGSVYCGKCGSKVEEPVVEASVSSSETSAFSPVQEAAPVPQSVAQPVQAPVGYARRRLKTSPILTLAPRQA